MNIETVNSILNPKALLLDSFLNIIKIYTEDVENKIRSWENGQ